MSSNQNKTKQTIKSKMNSTMFSRTFLPCLGSEDDSASSMQNTNTERQKNNNTNHNQLCVNSYTLPIVVGPSTRRN